MEKFNNWDNQFFKTIKGLNTGASGIYRSEDGTELYGSLRIDSSDGKDYKVVHKNGNGEWKWGKGDNQPILYNKHLIVDAPLDQDVHMTEGERNANYLTQLGFLSTTLPFGAKDYISVDKEEAQLLKGRNIIHHIDSDEVGRRFGDARLRWLSGIAVTQKKVDHFPDRDDGSDVSDAGYNKESLQSKVDDIPYYRFKGDASMSLEDILDGIVAIYHKYVVMTNAQASTIALWIAHTFVFRAFYITPYLNIRSAIKRSGKSTTLDICDELAWHSIKADNISTAVVAHMVDKGRTLCIDEYDKLFYGKNANQELIGICNSGYRSKGRYWRMVGQGGATMEPHGFSTFGPKAFAGNRSLPDTIDDRSVIVNLKRKATSEKRAEFLLEDVMLDCKPYADQLELWSAQAKDVLRNSRPDRPQQLNDRLKDSWRALLAIANLAGDRWSQIGWDSALELSGVQEDDNSLEIQLLRDIKSIFEDVKSTDRIHSSTLVDDLRELEETPWSNLGKYGLTVNTLASFLKPFDIHSKQVRIGPVSKKGYFKEWFSDAWSRYLSPVEGDSGETSETPKLTHAYAPNETTASVNGNVSDNQQAQFVPNVSGVSFYSGGGGRSDEYREHG